MRAPFSVFKKKVGTGYIWYARFWSEGAQAYTVSRSTGIEVSGKNGRRSKAEAVARDELLPQIANITDVSKMNLVEYLFSCWSVNSKMIREKQSDGVGKKISLAYITGNHSAVDKWIKPFPILSRLTVGDVTKAKINDWKLDASAKGCGTRRVNATLQAIRVPISWAVSRGDLVSDPLAGVKKVGYKAQEKGVLTVPEVQAILSIADFDDPRALFGIQLALLVGLRRGELRGLKWSAIDRASGQIRIDHNYVDDEGGKNCKWGSSRVVFLPSAVLPALDALAAVSPWKESGDYVLFDIEKRDRPCSTQVLQRGFVHLVRLAGINDEARKARNITLHSCRHTAATLALNAGISDAVVQGLAGWKSGEMMERYSHVGQVIDFDAARKRLEDSLRPNEQESDYITRVETK